MKNKLFFAAFLASILMSHSAFAILIPKYQESVWRCTANDTFGLAWQVEDNAKHAAINKAMRICERRSRSPATCQVATEWCTYLYQHKKSNRKWRCGAFDDGNGFWRGGIHYSRQDAIDSALYVCEHESMYPRSCQVNVQTCKYLGK